MGGGECEASGVRAGGRLRAGRGRRGRDELVTGWKESRREGEKGVGEGGALGGCVGAFLGDSAR